MAGKPGRSGASRERMQEIARARVAAQKAAKVSGAGALAKTWRNAWETGGADPAGAQSREDESRGAPAHQCDPNWPGRPGGCNLPATDPERIYYGCAFNAYSGTEHKRRKEARDFAFASAHGWSPMTPGWTPP